MVPPFGKLDPPCLQVVWSEELQELEMVLVCLEMGSAELVPGALGSWQLEVSLFLFGTIIVALRGRHGCAKVT